MDAVILLGDDTSPLCSKPVLYFVAPPFCKLRRTRLSVARERRLRRKGERGVLLSIFSRERIYFVSTYRLTKDGG